jgi:hypothetical protein
MKTLKTLITLAILALSSPAMHAQIQSTLDDGRTLYIQTRLVEVFRSLDTNGKEGARELGYIQGIMTSDSQLCMGDASPETVANMVADHYAEDIRRIPSAAYSHWTLDETDGIVHNLMLLHYMCGHVRTRDSP